MFTVDPAASTPVYEQLVECVLRDVSSGELMVGDRIPPVSYTHLTLPTIYSV